MAYAIRQLILGYHRGFFTIGLCKGSKWLRAEEQLSDNLVPFPTSDPSNTECAWSARMNPAMFPRFPNLS